MTTLIGDYIRKLEELKDAGRSWKMAYKCIYLVGSVDLAGGILP